ncbi:hypothetical protein M2161_006766 [Streptomyces sp. SAI-133]|nr:hypothetical protein [Streptomyces sp. SAI-041]MDH6587660.1 hypothetical protein [Streptomyces sp. SAI-133]
MGALQGYFSRTHVWNPAARLALRSENRPAERPLPNIDATSDRGSRGLTPGPTSPVSSATAPRKTRLWSRSGGCRSRRGRPSSSSPSCSEPSACARTHRSPWYAHWKKARRSAASGTGRSPRFHRSTHADRAGPSPPTGAPGEEATTGRQRRRPSTSTARPWSILCETPTSRQAGLGGEGSSADGGRTALVDPFSTHRRTRGVPHPQDGDIRTAATPVRDRELHGSARAQRQVRARLAHNSRVDANDELTVICAHSRPGHWAPFVPAATAAAAIDPEADSAADTGFAAARPPAAGTGSGVAGPAAGRTAGKPRAHQDRHRCSCSAWTP